MSEEKVSILKAEPGSGEMDNRDPPAYYVAGARAEVS